jgi:hypothetical protein
MSYRNFAPIAPSREPVVLALLALLPPSPRQTSQCALTSDIAQAGPTGSGHEREPGEACPRPARIVKPETASNLFARPLCLRAFVVWSVVVIYNYLPIVITKCRRYQNPAPWKSSLIRPPSPSDPQARPASRARVRARACRRSLSDRRCSP